MTLYFFDITSGAPQPDVCGTDFDNVADVRKEAVRALAEVALDHIPANGTRCSLSVVARRAGGGVVYGASLAFVETFFEMA